MTNLSWTNLTTQQNIVNSVYDLSLEGDLLIWKVASTELNESLDSLTSHGDVLINKRFSYNLKQDGNPTDKVYTLEIKWEWIS